MISDYLLFLILGPRMTQGLNALGTIGNIPALARLCSDLSSIDVGICVPINDGEIRAGLDELKSLLDMRVDSRQDLDERHKQLTKQGNGYLVDGLYRNVISFLLQKCTRFRCNEFDASAARNGFKSTQIERLKRQFLY